MVNVEPHPTTSRSLLPTMLICAMAIALGPMLAPSTAAADGTLVNRMCPVRTDESASDQHTSEYEGQTIGFCCRMCLSSFEREPESYLAAVGLGGDAEHENGHDAHEHGPHDHTDEHHDNGHGNGHDHNGHDGHNGHNGHNGHEDHHHHHGDVPPLLEWLGQFHALRSTCR